MKFIEKNVRPIPIMRATLHEYEDPASGAANGLLAAFIQTMEPNGELSGGYDVSQGREIGHDATLKIRFEKSSEPAVVWVGGQTHTVIDGRLCWPV